MNFILAGDITLYISTVAALAAIFSFWLSTKKWITKAFATVHVAFLLFPFTMILVSFLSDYFHIYQVYAHSSKEMALYYKVAAIWESQEGSLLLWATFNSILIFYFFTLKNKWRSLEIAIIFLLQLFLLIPNLKIPVNDWFFTPLFAETSQILGLKTGSLTEKLTLSDGKGLNPLLANIWMTIHPPIIFLAFSVAFIPFSQSIKGLLAKDFTWTAQAAKSLKLSLIILSIGMLFGAYWAYETLNFGGFWSWDPVENAIYIPWLCGIISLHFLHLSNRFHKGFFLSQITIFLFYILIIYSTYLTRSGILGNSSVHSFINSDQHDYFLIMLLCFLFIGFTIILFNFKQIPRFEEKISFRKRTEWIYAGMMILSYAILHVLSATSIPVFSQLLNTVGLDNNSAPVENASKHFGYGQLLFYCLAATILLWIEIPGLRKRSIWILLPGIIALAFWFTNEKWFIFLSGIIAFTCIAFLLIRINKSSRKGPYLSHIGLSVLTIGALFSEGLFYDNDTDRNYFLPFGSKKGDFEYVDQGFYFRGSFISGSKLLPTLRNGFYLAEEDIINLNDTIWTGELLKINDTDKYYKVRFREEITNHHLFFKNQKEYFISPVIKHALSGDDFLHLTNFRDIKKIIWDTIPGILPELTQQIKITRVPGIHLAEGDLAFIQKYSWDGNYLTAIKVFKDNKPIYFGKTDVKNGRRLVFDNNHKPMLMESDPDWISIKVVRKPMISLFWIGCLMVIAGMILSFLEKSKYRFSTYSKRIFYQKKIVNHDKN